jgi:hypothetical protein
MRMETLRTSAFPPRERFRDQFIGQSLEAGARRTWSARSRGNFGGFKSPSTIPVPRIIRVQKSQQIVINRQNTRNSREKEIQTTVVEHCAHAYLGFVSKHWILAIRTFSTKKHRDHTAPKTNFDAACFQRFHMEVVSIRSI